MFNNPIKKYQTGGKATPQQEQQIAQLFEAASKNTGIDVETLMNAANQMPDENSMKQYVQAISMAAQGDQNAISSIKKMFSQQPTMKKLGGKIRDFICKHAKGGQIADCGCGSKVPKAEMGISGIGEEQTTGNRFSRFWNKHVGKVMPSGATLTKWQDKSGAQHYQSLNNIKGNTTKYYMVIPQPGDSTLFETHVILPDS